MKKWHLENLLENQSKALVRPRSSELRRRNHSVALPAVVLASASAGLELKFCKEAKVNFVEP